MIVVDTGVLFAAADHDDRNHQPCAAILANHRPDELIVPAAVVVEAAWMIEGNVGSEAEAAFLERVSGDTRVINLTGDDLARCAELIRTYANLPLGFVDATVVAVAERLNITTVATVDRRDFTIVRPTHVDAFELIP